MNYSCDPRKGQSNLKRHGIAFDDAIRIVDGPTLEKVDDRFACREIRVDAIGVANGLEITPIYTDVFGVRTPNHFGMEGRTA
jgi:uncharacterized DUF497 family protein